MFSTLICLSFHPWSIPNFKDKSGRVSIPFQVMLWANTLEDPLFSKYGHEGRHSSKEILRIGMFRTPFSCGYYQQQHILGETKIILSCLFLLEAHGFEYLCYRPIIIKYDSNTCINYDISASQMLWQMKKTLLGTQIILSLNSIEHKCTLILKFVITE